MGVCKLYTPTCFKPQLQNCCQIPSVSIPHRSLSLRHVHPSDSAYSCLSKSCSNNGRVVCCRPTLTTQIQAKVGQRSPIHTLNYSLTLLNQKITRTGQKSKIGCLNECGNFDRGKCYSLVALLTGRWCRSLQHLAITCL